MKKIAIRLILAIALIFVPVSSFALDMISDSDMEAVTGQAGVEIAITEAIDMNVTIDGLSFNNSDSGIALDMVSQAGTDGMNIVVGVTDAARPMSLDIKSENSDTIINVGLPGTTISVSNIPDIKIGITDNNGAVDNLGTLSVGNTSLKINTGKVSMKLL